MTEKSTKNVAASVRQRLLNKSRSDIRPFQEIAQHFAMERFLFRLSKSRYANVFILKGALMLRIWQTPGIRTTMDIDLLGRTDNDLSKIISIVEEILSLDIEPDGLIFSSENITGEQITDAAEYHGVRVCFPAKLDAMNLSMQIDIGFGDIIYPGPEQSEIPCMLDFEPPRLLGYSRESAIAEKFEAMIRHGELNSRMKDFYDIWLLSRHFDFKGDILSEALRLTLKQRGTEIPKEISAFSNKFISAKQIQWNAFRKRLKQEHIPEKFEDVVRQLKSFIVPIASALGNHAVTPTRWSAPGPWA